VLYSTGARRARRAEDVIEKLRTSAEESSAAMVRIMSGGVGECAVDVVKVAEDAVELAMLLGAGTSPPALAS